MLTGEKETKVGVGVEGKTNSTSSSQNEPVSSQSAKRIEEK
jgi:hypothetical protein